MTKEGRWSAIDNDLQQVHEPEEPPHLCGADPICHDGGCGPFLHTAGLPRACLSQFLLQVLYIESPNLFWDSKDPDQEDENMAGGKCAKPSGKKKDDKKKGGKKK